MVVFDDLLATGGSFAATAELLTRLGAKVLGFLVMVELRDLGGRAKLREKCGENVVVRSLTSV